MCAHIVHEGHLKSTDDPCTCSARPNRVITLAAASQYFQTDPSTPGTASTMSHPQMGTHEIALVWGHIRARIYSG